VSAGGIRSHINTVSIQGVQCNSVCKKCLKVSMNYLSVNTESYFDERYEQELTHVISYVTKDLKHVS